MKKLAASLTIFALALFLSSCATPAPLPPSAQPEKDLAISENTFAWINAHRAKEGAKPLRRVSSLDRLARKIASQVGNNKLATYSHSTQSGVIYARQILRYETEGMAYEGNLSAQKEPGLTAVNYWSKAPYSSTRILRSHTSVGIGSFTKPNGQTIISVLIGTKFHHDPSPWGYRSQYYY